MFGYGGKILRVDLTNGTHQVEPVSEKMVREYIGGRGFVAKILYDEVPKGADPLGPENVVVIASGPLAGTFAPAGGKVHFGAKSPATGGYGDSNMGGHFAAEMKYAGYDVIVLKGAAAGPSSIVIEDGKVQIRDGSKYWGKGALEAERMMKDDLGEDFQIALIGPAGENLVAFACVSHDFGRQAGRTGVGAVLGSKKVKAIAIRGTQGFPLAGREKVIKKGKEIYDTAFAHPALKEWQDYGTASVTTWVNSIGSFPTKNFQTSYMEGHEVLSGEEMRKRIIITDKACFGCPMACGKYSHTKTGKYEAFVEGPEYETTALVGGNCLLPTIEDVAYANYVMDELGLDTISGGGVVAFALECIEKGILSKDDFEGKDLKFGDIDSVVYLSHLIASRKGIGDLLAQGVKKAAQAIGRGSDHFAIQVKGLEWSGYESRYAPAMMLSYMTCDVGSHHNRSWAITHDIAVGREQVEGKAKRVIELQHIRPMFDMLGACRLPWVELGIDLNHYADIFSVITGIDYNLEDLLHASERVWNLTRAFWKREVPEFGRSFDYPPPRFYKEEIPTGPAKGHKIPMEELDRLLDEYYQLRGWTRDGLPTREKLLALGLDYVVRDLGAGDAAVAGT